MMIKQWLRKLSLLAILFLTGLVSGSESERLPGTWYETIVPDTLDLAHRAELAINGITGLIEPSDYEIYGFIRFENQPAFLQRHPNSKTVLMSKCLEALPMLRVMSGSAQNLDLEEGSWKLILDNISAEDGLYWVPATPERIRLGQTTDIFSEVKVDLACIYAQFRTPRALMVWYQYTGDPKYKELP